MMNKKLYVLMESMLVSMLLLAALPIRIQSKPYQIL